MPMFLSLCNECCMNCGLCNYDTGLGYYCFSNDYNTFLHNPLVTCCEKYMSKSTGKKKSANVKREDVNDMIVSPFKEVSVPKTVFNKDYWKVGDAYVIKTPNTKPKFYVLEEVVEMSYVLMNNGVTFSPEDFNTGGCELINHISLDYACSKSMAAG